MAGELASGASSEGARDNYEKLALACERMADDLEVLASLKKSDNKEAG